MQYRRMGRSGLKLSEVAVGSWMTDLKGREACDTAKEVLRRAYDSGVNFFDCADAYSGGQAEVFLGNILKEFRRSSYVVSSKVFFPVGDGPNDRGLSRKHIVEQLNRSLKNLQVDYLDWSPVQITKALGLIQKHGYRPLSVIQPQYNMVDRYIEDEIMGICEENGVGIVPFSPLSQGLLTGKYRKGQPIPEGSRATHQADKQINQLLTEENLDKVEKLLRVAKELGVSLSVLALAWILRKPAVTSVITGASKASQLAGNLDASGFRIPQEALEEIEKILDYHPFVRRIG